MEGLPLTLRLPRTLRLPLVLAVGVPLLLPKTPLGVAVGCSGEAVGKRGEGLMLPLPPSPPLLGLAVPDASTLVGVGGSEARPLPEETGEAEMEAQGEAERGGVGEAVAPLLRVAVEHRDSVRVGVMEEVGGAEKDWLDVAVVQDKAVTVPASMEALAEAEELRESDTEVEGSEKVGKEEAEGRGVALPPPPPASPGLTLALLLALPLCAPVTVNSAVRDAEAQPELLRLGSAVEVGAVPVNTTVNEGVGLCDPGSTETEAAVLQLAALERVGAEAEEEALPTSEALEREEADIEGEDEAEPVGMEERDRSVEADGTPVSCGVREIAAVGVSRGGEGVTLPLGARLLPEGLADTLREELTLTQREVVRVTRRLPVAQLVPGSDGVTGSVMGAVALSEAEPVLVAVASELALLGAEGAADSESAVVRVRLGDALTLGLRSDVTVAEEDARALLLREAVGETEAEPLTERDESSEGEPNTLRVTASTLGVESREGDEAMEGEAATLLLALTLLVPRSEGVLLAVAARPGEELAMGLREGSREPVPTAVALKSELALLVASRDSVARAVKDAEDESEGVNAAVAVEDHEAPLPLGATLPEPRPLEGDREGEGDKDKGAVALIVAKGLTEMVAVLGALPVRSAVTVAVEEAQAVLLGEAVAEGEGSADVERATLPLSARWGEVEGAGEPVNDTVAHALALGAPAVPLEDPLMREVREGEDVAVEVAEAQGEAEGEGETVGVAQLVGEAEPEREAEGQCDVLAPALPVAIVRDGGALRQAEGVEVRQGEKVEVPLRELEALGITVFVTVPLPPLLLPVAPCTVPVCVGEGEAAAENVAAVLALAAPLRVACTEDEAAPLPLEDTESEPWVETDGLPDGRAETELHRLLLGDAPLLREAWALPLMLEVGEAEPLSREREAVEVGAELPVACVVTEGVYVALLLVASEAEPVALAEKVLPMVRLGDDEAVVEPELVPAAMPRDTEAPALKLGAGLPEVEAVPELVRVGKGQAEGEDEPLGVLLCRGVAEGSTVRAGEAVPTALVLDWVRVGAEDPVMPRGVAESTGVRDWEGVMEGLPELERHAVLVGLSREVTLTLPVASVELEVDAEPVWVRVREGDSVAVAVKVMVGLPEAVAEGENVGEIEAQALMLPDSEGCEGVDAPLGV